MWQLQCIARPTQWRASRSLRTSYTTTSILRQKSVNLSCADLNVFTASNFRYAVTLVHLKKWISSRVFNSGVIMVLIFIQVTHWVTW